MSRADHEGRETKPETTSAPPPPPPPPDVAAVPAEPMFGESPADDVMVFPRYQVQYEDHECHSRSTWAYCRLQSAAVTIARMLNDTRSWRGDFIVRDIRGGVVYAP